MLEKCSQIIKFKSSAAGKASWALQLIPIINVYILKMGKDRDEQIEYSIHSQHFLASTSWPSLIATKFLTAKLFLLQNESIEAKYLQFFCRQNILNMWQNLNIPSSCWHIKLTKCFCTLAGYTNSLNKLNTSSVNYMRLNVINFIFSLLCLLTNKFKNVLNNENNLKYKIEMLSIG